MFLLNAASGMIWLSAALCSGMGAAISQDLDAPFSARVIIAEQVFEGIVSELNEETSEVVLTTIDEQDVTLKLSNETVYFIDGKPATRDEVLRIGRRVTAVAEEAVAVKFEATST